MKERKLSLVIPCYNEEGAIEETLVDISKYFEGASFDYQVIVVNDGSSDQTGPLLDSLQEKIPHLKVLHHRSNKGYGASLKTGILASEYDYIAITDADGTYPNEKIREFFESFENLDMLVGSRTSSNVTYPLIRKIPKVFLKAFVSYLVDYKVPDMNSGLRIFKKEIVMKYFNLFPDGFSFTTTITMITLRGRYEVEFRPIDYMARTGKSKIQPIRDTLRFLYLIFRTGFYFAPLRAFGPFILATFLGFLASLFYDIFYNNNLTDKTTVLLLLFSNMLMVTLVADMIEKRSVR